MWVIRDIDLDGGIGNYFSRIKILIDDNHNVWLKFDIDYET